MMQCSRMTTTLKMTNLLLAVACAAVLMGSATADEEEGSMTVDEVVELIEPFGDACTPKPSRENIVEMVLNKEDAKHETKCFRHCMLEQFELMPEDQLQYNEDKTVDMINMMFPDREDDGRRIVKTCNEELKAEQDKCEAPHGIAMCMLREMRSSGFKIPEIKE
uniref:Odorant binding protein 19b n=1 Tax=Drosophila melanogaster TaxID=7227 RepID=E2DBD7_DROME|nr:odorant binding protein 19b [Drosophila melanogaster]